jgi:frataxin-like iron-binding protein CyaY
VLECFLSRGVDVDVKNARGHTPMDLATEPKTKKLIAHATKMKQCENSNCKGPRKFDFKNIRYYCTQSNQFFCKKCSMTQWVYETPESEEMERPICRSLVVNEKILGHEKHLTAAIEAYNF